MMKEHQYAEEVCRMDREIKDCVTILDYLRVSETEAVRKQAWTGC